jgi:hypothetical protein
MVCIKVSNTVDNQCRYQNTILCYLDIHHNLQTGWCWRLNATASVSETERGCDHVLAGRLLLFGESGLTSSMRQSIRPSGQKSKNDDLLLRQSESS